MAPPQGLRAAEGGGGGRVVVGAGRGRVKGGAKGEKQGLGAGPRAGLLRIHGEGAVVEESETIAKQKLNVVK